MPLYVRHNVFLIDAFCHLWYVECHFVGTTCRYLPQNLPHCVTLYVCHKSYVTLTRLSHIMPRSYVTLHGIEENKKK